MKVYLPHPNSEDELESVVIDDYDTWNVDVSLATIIHPLLVAFKTGEHGYPSGFDSWDDWQRVIDAMIYSFGQASEHYPKLGNSLAPEDYEKESEKLSEGFILFGKYYTNLWT